MRYMRLFKCSNENGYFVVTEKYADFCQVLLKQITNTSKNNERKRDIFLFTVLG